MLYKISCVIRDASERIVVEKETVEIDVNHTMSRMEVKLALDAAYTVLRHISNDKVIRIMNAAKLTKG